jgi:hypothetical protein
MIKLCMILPLALILCFIVGRQDKEAMKTQAEVEEQRTDYDRLGMMQQLGFELKPKEGE